MQLTSTFILAAVLALKATSVTALPFSSNDIATMDARDVASYYDSALEARFFDDELEEFDARELGEEFDLDARDFDDYVQFEARGRFDRKISAEQKIMDKEAARIKAEQARLKTQQSVMRLQEQIHGDKKTLRKDNFGNPLPGSAKQQSNGDSRFDNRIKQEQRIMDQEAKRIKDQQQQLLTQNKDVSLQEQIRKDRQALQADGNVFRRRGYFESW
jgi:hypothetical protein